MLAPRPYRSLMAPPRDDEPQAGRTASLAEVRRHSTRRPRESPQQPPPAPTPRGGRANDREPDRREGWRGEGAMNPGRKGKPPHALAKPRPAAQPGGYGGRRVPRGRAGGPDPRWRSARTMPPHIIEVESHTHQRDGRAPRAAATATTVGSAGIKDTACGGWSRRALGIDESVPGLPCP